MASTALPSPSAPSHLGADKTIECSDPNCPPSNNPALGLRAIRLCLKEPDLFLPQLRAILRASAEGQVRLMIPMLSCIAELQETLALLEQTKQELSREGLRFNATMPVGGMIEIPAAAIAAASFARQLDFLSIGTNDLIQYTLAVDRMDESVNYLFDPLHPSVLQLIQMTIHAANNAGIPISMCGEMAGDPLFTQLLLGMGLRELSMQPGAPARDPPGSSAPAICRAPHPPGPSISAADAQQNQPPPSSQNCFTSSDTPSICKVSPRDGPLVKLRPGLPGHPD